MHHARIQAEWIDITPTLRGYLALPAGQARHPAMLVFIEAFGVNDHFKSLAIRLAESGYVALVPDIYHGHTYDYTDMENAIAHLRSLKDEIVMRETVYALDLLMAHPAVNGHPPGVLGFCMGGRYAFMANGLQSEHLGAAVVYYGGGIAPQQDPVGRTPLLHLVPAMHAPLLLHYGASDKSILPDEHGRIAEALGQHQKRYGLQVYPEAGHGFFCDQRASYHPIAAAESWHLTLDFFASHLKV